MKEFYKQVYKKLQQKVSAYVITVIDEDGSTPRASGALMAVFSDDSIIGTIGGGGCEFKTQKLALQKLKAGETTSFYHFIPMDLSVGVACGGNVNTYFQYIDATDSAQVEFYGKLLKVMASPDTSWLTMEIDQKTEAWSLALINHNNQIVEQLKNPISKELTEIERIGDPVLFEQEHFSRYTLPINFEGLVYVFGGGHVSQQLVPVLAKVGYRCVVIDDREEYANTQLFPTAYKTMTQAIPKVDEVLTINPEDYMVIITRGHAFDREALAYALTTSAGYVGMIGSKSKIAYTYDHLIREKTIDFADTNRVHAPIGYEIGAETPEEIAISIAAELIAYRRLGKVGFTAEKL